ncbi:MAG: DUF3667 domain-containing protein [Chitinophagales bacterium]
MTKHCLNCGNIVTEKFCPNCGQDTGVRKITWKSFSEEFIHALTHGEKSILGTTVQLLSHPGKVLDEYIAGKRRKYHSPVGYFLILLALSVIFQRLAIAKLGFHPVIREGLTFSNIESIEVFIKHGTWLYIFTFPFSAAIFYFVLARPTYSYIESLVITMYAFSFTYVLFVLCYIIGGLIFSINVLHWKFYLFQITLALSYTVWVCFDIYRNKKKKMLWLRISFYLIINTVIVLKLLEFLSNAWVFLEHYFSVA